MDNILKKRQFGSLEMKAIAYLQLKNMKTVGINDFQGALGIARQTEKDLLVSLNRKGIIVRLTTGYYLVPDKISPSSYAQVDEMEKLVYLMEYYKAKYMISGPTAIYYYGYTTQIPNRVYVYNDKIYGDRNIAGSSFVFMRTSAKRIKAVVTIKKSNGIEVPYTSQTRLLIDCIYDWNRFNTIPRVYSWIKDEIEKDPAITENLVNDAIRYGNKSVQRRLGYLIDTLDVNDKYINKLEKKITGTKSIIPWIPNTDLKGKLDSKWGIIINGRI
jgi:predicted transcriptional regulator of viral defense system